MLLSASSRWRNSSCSLEMTDINKATVHFQIFSNAKWYNSLKLVWLGILIITLLKSQEVFRHLKLFHSIRSQIIINGMCKQMMLDIYKVSKYVLSSFCSGCIKAKGPWGKRDYWFYIFQNTSKHCHNTFLNTGLSLHCTDILTHEVTVCSYTINWGEFIHI